MDKNEKLKEKTLTEDNFKQEGKPLVRREHCTKQVELILYLLFFCLVSQS